MLPGFGLLYYISIGIPWIVTKRTRTVPYLIYHSNLCAYLNVRLSGFIQTTLPQPKTCNFSYPVVRNLTSSLSQHNDLKSWNPFPPSQTIVFFYNLHEQKQKLHPLKKLNEKKPFPSAVARAWFGLEKKWISQTRPAVEGFKRESSQSRRRTVELTASFDHTRWRLQYEP